MPTRMNIVPQEFPVKYLSMILDFIYLFQTQLPTQQRKISTKFIYQKQKQLKSMQQQPQGFPVLNTPLRIINKLNNMALTISEGWHNTKIDSVIIDQPIHADKQRFKITEKDHMRVYYIEPTHKEYLLSTRSGWTDMVYSEVKIEKYTKQNNQLWRIVPYGDVVYTQNSQQKKTQLKSSPQIQYELKPVSSSPSQLGYHSQENHIQEVKVQPKTGDVTTSIYKLGYEFDSGPYVQTSIDVKTKGLATDILKNFQPVQQQFDIANPPRFPIKQKNNLQPIDLQNNGWFFIQNVKFNLVLQVQGGIDEPGMSIVLNRLNGNRNQLWRFQ